MLKFTGAVDGGRPVWDPKACSRDTVHTHGAIRLPSISTRRARSLEVNPSALRGPKKC